MFAAGWRESEESEITINGVRGDILQLLADFCYSGQITVDNENVDEVVAAATLLQFNEVIEICAEQYLTLFHTTSMN